MCRDVYYRDPALFRKQSCVDRIIESLAYTLLIPRSCLHVVSPLYFGVMQVAAAKGLISGHLTIQMRHGSEAVNVALSAMVLPIAWKID